MLLDIHSHILPKVDDGAKSLSESIELLKMLKSQGVTDVVATPHFYPMDESLEGYLSKINSAYAHLKNEISNMGLPSIYLGHEVLYYRSIGQTDTARNFCIGNTRFLLLELPNRVSLSDLFEDIISLRDAQGITVIIAHLERYRDMPGYKTLLDFLKKNRILSQINASSFFSRDAVQTAHKLLRGGYLNFIGTDTHSVDTRPPLIKQALEYITDNFGTEYASGFIRNSQIMLEKITEAQNEKPSP